MIDKNWWCRAALWRRKQHRVDSALLIDAQVLASIDSCGSNLERTQAARLQRGSSTLLFYLYSLNRCAVIVPKAFFPKRYIQIFI